MEPFIAADDAVLTIIAQPVEYCWCELSGQYDTIAEFNVDSKAELNLARVARRKYTNIYKKDIQVCVRSRTKI